MKYTALEIVKKTGVENPEALFGAVAIEIGGIAVNSPDHILNTQDAEEVAVVIGTTDYVAALPEEDPLEMSEGVKAIRAEEEKVALEAEAATSTPTEA